MHDEQLHALIGSTRARAAADDRRRASWLQRQLREDREFTAAAELVARDQPVELWTAVGHAYRGRLLAARELFAIHTGAATVYVVDRSVVGMRPVRAAQPPAPDAATLRGTTLDAVLGELAAHRAMATLVTLDGRTHRGVVDVLGQDLVRLGGSGTLLRLAALTEVVEDS